MDNDNRFYVYALLDTRKPGRYEYKDICFLYEPFYIGKGTGNRIKRHTSPQMLLSKTPKNNKIKKLIKCGLKPIEHIIEDKLLNDKALDMEILLIDLIGRKDLGVGFLTNTTNGGEGASVGHIVKESTKRKISNSLMGKNVGRELTDEWKLKISNNNARYWKNKTHSKDTIKKIKEWRSTQNMSYKTKSYILTSPLNKKFIVIDGLQKFCDKYELSRSHLISVAKGRRNHHKEWKCDYYLPN